MPSLIKSELRNTQLHNFSYSLDEIPSYILIANEDQWADEQNPPTPDNSSQSDNAIFDSLVGLKRIKATDIVPIIPRINWISGVVYDQVDHRVDLTVSGDQFYVMTDTLNVYKCISNNYGTPSTSKPEGTASERIQTQDGYVWKYMFTVSTTDEYRFLNSEWIPCRTKLYNDGSPQWDSQTSATPGTIDTIRVINGGVGYSATENPPTIEINGDGSNAQATPIVDPNTTQITDIVITNNGINYTAADIVILNNGSNGTGAVADATIGTRHGHGHDPELELGADKLMVKVDILGEEIMPYESTYRTSGIIQLPKLNDDSGLVIGLSPTDAKLFSVGDSAIGTVSGASGTIVFNDTSKGLLYINNVIGGFLQTDKVSSNSFNESDILSIHSSNTPMTSTIYSGERLDVSTGSVLVINNRTPVTRAIDQNESITIILSF